MWKKELDPFIFIDIDAGIHDILPLIFSFPGIKTFINLTICLPTSGREPEFIDSLAILSEKIDELKLRFPEAALFV